MKKIFILLFAMICLLLTSCKESTDLNDSKSGDMMYDIELGDSEYDRVGEGRMTIRVPAPVTLSEACEQAEMVVKVQITDFYGTYKYKSERSSYDDVTLFSARIIETYNNCDAKAGDIILIRQLGSPNATIIGYPLYKIGDVFLVCLVKEDISIYEQGYPETVYSIINGMYGILQEIRIDNRKYFINRAYIGYCEEITGSRVDEKEKNQVIRALFDYDSVLKDYLKKEIEVYNAEDVINYLEGKK